MRYWEPMTDEALDRIHETACRILDELGIRIKGREVVDLLTDAGVTRVNEETVLR